MAKMGGASSNRCYAFINKAVPTTKTLIWIGMLVGGIAGGYAPVLFGASLFSIASLAGNTVGGLIGIAIGYKIATAYGW